MRPRSAPERINSDTTADLRRLQITLAQQLEGFANHTRLVAVRYRLGEGGGIRIEHHGHALSSLLLSLRPFAVDR